MSKRFLSWLMLSCMIIFAGSTDLHAIMIGDKLDIGGYLQNETSFSTKEGGDILWSENKLLVYGTYNITHQFRAFFRVQGYYDAINSLQSHDYRDISGDRYVDRQTYFRENIWTPKTYTTSEYLKELFVEYENEYFDLRVGKQQFAWGVTDGLKVLDIVYPQDFRKFNQEDFEESRIPLWSVKFDYYVGADSEIQLVYIPNFEGAFFPGAGHPFATWDKQFFDTLDVTGGNTPVEYRVRYDEPTGTIDKGEYGAMWRQNLGGWSYSLNFLSHFTDAKCAYQTNSTMIDIPHPVLGLPNLIRIPTFIELTLKNERMYSVGGSFDTTLSHLPLLGSIIFRAEAIYNFENIMINTPASFTIPVGPNTTLSNFMGVPVVGPNGDIIWNAGVPFPETVRIDDWTYALGIDKYIFTDYFISFQFVQHHIRGYKPSFVNPVTGQQAEENDYWCTFLLQKDWLNEKLWTKILNVVGRHGDYWIQPQASYLLKDKYKLTLQGNIYGGTQGNMWSRYERNDNIAMRLAYQF